MVGNVSEFRGKFSPAFMTFYELIS
jgi:hypothetical protein